MIASPGTSSPSAAETFLYLMRAPVRLSSWLKLTVLRDTAAYSLIGMLTRPKLMAPLQMALGIRGSIPVSTADAKGNRGETACRRASHRCGAAGLVRRRFADAGPAVEAGR